MARIYQAHRQLRTRSPLMNLVHYTAILYYIPVILSDSGEKRAFVAAIPLLLPDRTQVHKP